MIYFIVLQWFLWVNMILHRNISGIHLCHLNLKFQNSQFSISNWPNWPNPLQIFSFLITNMNMILETFWKYSTLPPPPPAPYMNLTQRHCLKWSRRHHLPEMIAPSKQDHIEVASHNWVVFSYKVTTDLTPQLYIFNMIDLSIFWNIIQFPDMLEGKR